MKRPKPQSAGKFVAHRPTTDGPSDPEVIIEATLARMDERTLQEELAEVVLFTAAPVGSARVFPRVQSGAPPGREDRIASNSLVPR